jgi:hypothetical protein
MAKILACFKAKIKGIPELGAYFQASTFWETAMSRILHRSLRHTPPVAVGGEGIWLRDSGAATTSMPAAAPPCPRSATGIRT